MLWYSRRPDQNQMASIASVTTAYNAAQVLPRQMEALLGQTRSLQEIVVVDNGSTDGTRQLLAERYPQVTVLEMPGNLGAAGAWSAGLAYAALEKRHDWVWAFDDDSVPAPGALEGPVETAESRTAVEANTGMVAGVPVHQQAALAIRPCSGAKVFTSLQPRCCRSQYGLPISPSPRD